MNARRTLMIVAHPDDEILGAGIWMHRNRRSEIYLAHLTSGSPIDSAKAARLGFESRDAYAQARQRELQDALALLSFPADRCFSFGLTDQQVHLELKRLMPDLTRLAADLKPDLVVTHCYEGGHPDHDSAAFATSRLRSSIDGLALLEFPLYHAVPGTSEACFGTFLEGDADSRTKLCLKPAEVEFKRRMLSCFGSQHEMLCRFDLSAEWLRPALPYDFGRRPHVGTILYEQWNFGVAWSTWAAHIQGFLDDPKQR